MKFKFKDGVKAEIGTDDPWYALTDGGHLHPENLLTDKMQLAALSNAVELVYQFIAQCYMNEIIEEC